MLAAAAGGLILLGNVYQKGFSCLGKSKMLWVGIGFVFLSLLGLVNSPEKFYSLKQLAVLIVLIVLGIFFELNIKQFGRAIYLGLAMGLAVSSMAAIYQNVAFEFGWPHFETMAALPNAFFPEADWLGMYLALGLLPFLVALTSNIKIGLPKTFQNKYWLYILSLLTITALIITVARASWLALIAEIGIILTLPALTNIVMSAKAKIQEKFGGLPDSLSAGRQAAPRGSGKKIYKQFLVSLAYFASLIFVSLFLINLFHLTRFDIPDRFRSIFFREHIITVAENPDTGESFKIDLEEIEKYRSQGYLIKKNFVTDENVASRGERATSAWGTIKSHPIIGNGLGITLINTNFKHNANNLFLEWWASAGIGGLVLILALLIYLIYRGIILSKTAFASAALVLTGTAGFIIINLFNSSIFLAFAWFYLAWLSSHTTYNMEHTT